MLLRQLVRRSTSLIFTFATTLAVCPAQAGLITNGSFENLGPGLSGSFLMKPGATNEVTGWTTTAGASFLLFPNTATIPVGGISLWPGCQPGSTVVNCINPVPFPVESPSHGNFLAVDGEPSLSGTLTQTLFNLTPQRTYRVSYFQAAGQLHDTRNPNFLCCTGPTTEQWRVTLDDGVNIPFVHLSPLMSNASQSFVNWQADSFTFKATSATQVLGFFALGTPSGIPPFVLLDGVSVEALPEPPTLVLIGLGILGAFFARRRNRHG